MVIPMALLVAVSMATEATRPIWFHLTPEDRIRVLLALAILLFLGFAFAAFAWWAGRWTRRYMNRPLRPSRQQDAHGDDWARKPLLPPEEQGLGEFED
jgi:hypothetical protein